MSDLNLELSKSIELAKFKEASLNDTNENLGNCQSSINEFITQNRNLKSNINELQNDNLKNYDKIKKLEEDISQEHYLNR
jgi:hypothetical protein